MRILLCFSYHMATYTGLLLTQPPENTLKVFVSTLLGLPRPLTFCDFCRGGASWAFSRGVPIQEIQAKGT